MFNIRFGALNFQGYHLYNEEKNAMSHAPSESSEVFQLCLHS